MINLGVWDKCTRLKLCLFIVSDDVTFVTLGLGMGQMTLALILTNNCMPDIIKTDKENKMVNKLSKLIAKTLNQGAYRMVYHSLSNPLVILLMEVSKMQLLILCPKCDSVLDYSNTVASVVCPRCENEFDSADMHVVRFRVIDYLIHEIHRRIKLAAKSYLLNEILADKFYRSLEQYSNDLALLNKEKLRLDGPAEIKKAA